MKKILAIALSVVMMLGLLTACGEKDEVKTLKVALSPDFAPMEFVDPTKTGQDQYLGFDVTLAKYIAQELGMQLEIMPMSFKSCTTAVYTGTADMSISGFSWTEDRAENYNLSDYYNAGDNEDAQILITLAENEGKFTTADSLVGKKVGAQIASLQEDLCKDQLPGCEIVTIMDLGTALLQLKNGDFDVLAVAEGNGEAIIANNPGIIKSGFGFYVDPKYTGNVILLQKGNDELTAQVNDILAKAEQFYDEWYAEAQALAGLEQMEEVTITDPTEATDPSTPAESTLPPETTDPSTPAETTLPPETTAPNA